MAVYYAARACTYRFHPGRDTSVPDIFNGSGHKSSRLYKLQTIIGSKLLSALPASGYVLRGIAGIAVIRGIGSRLWLPLSMPGAVPRGA